MRRLREHKEQIKRRQNQDEDKTMAKIDKIRPRQREYLRQDKIKQDDEKTMTKIRQRPDEAKTRRRDNINRRQDKTRQDKKTDAKRRQNKARQE